MCAVRYQGQGEDHAEGSLMYRRYCDGCHHKGVVTELTEPHFARVRLHTDTATMLDLCFDCMPFYERWKTEMDTMAVRSAMNFRKAIKEYETEFWRRVKHGSKKSSAGGNVQVGAFKDRHIEPET